MLNVVYKNGSYKVKMYGFYAVWKVRGRIRHRIKRRRRDHAFLNDTSAGWFTMEVRLGWEGYS